MVFVYARQTLVRAMIIWYKFRLFSISCRKRERALYWHYWWSRMLCGWSVVKWWSKGYSSLSFKTYVVWYISCAFIRCAFQIFHSRLFFVTAEIIFLVTQDDTREISWKKCTWCCFEAQIKYSKSKTSFWGIVTFKKCDGGRVLLVVVIYIKYHFHNY